jgi:hypothetical protein
MTVAMGQKRTRAPQRTASLFDHIVGAREQRSRNDRADRLRGFEIDDELELRGLLHRKIGGFTAFEDGVHIARDLAASLRRRVRSATNGLPQRNRFV